MHCANYSEVEKLGTIGSDMSDWKRPLPGCCYINKQKPRAKVSWARKGTQPLRLTENVERSHAVGEQETILRNKSSRLTHLEVIRVGG